MKTDCWSKKTLGWGLLGLALAMFWDTLLPATAHGLHLLFGLFELVLGHALQYAFGLEPRQAQFVLAYAALALGLACLVHWTRKAWRAVRQAWAALRWQVSAWAQAAAKWKKLALGVGALGAAFYLLG